MDKKPVPHLQVELPVEEIIRMAVDTPERFDYAGFYYRNDQPNGFGVIIKERVPAFLRELEGWYKYFRAEPESERKNYLDIEAHLQLAEAHLYSDSPPSLDEAAKFKIFGPVTIWILTREGRMPQDEYNGIVLGSVLKEEPGVH